MAKRTENDFELNDSGFSFNQNVINKFVHSFHDSGRGFGIKYWILMLISKEKLTGAQMIDKMYEMSFGFWKPSPGSIYTILKYLLENKFVKVNEKDNKKYYFITEKGKEYLDSSWFPWRSISGFTNGHKEVGVSDTVEMVDNLSEFLLEKYKVLSVDDKKAIKRIEERLQKILKR
ncbi:MAG: transcriptional regulator PadR family protein [Candidatus Parvarchaeum acidophilus ARMAN-5]|jgi:DNA-binding PadR family transcriptional regulator|uniref:Transcriptional regulator PadR family protein n=1 Tax=Candidatus Parvarchaeum acidophilus ARMAN-5 TaxID=662762 RepID=D6GWD4_PARA5|nr:MAG: transcriptional regulator PadR family protein [Candidatus Parvarchaeum acidophilus ARMAN-5]